MGCGACWQYWSLLSKYEFSDLVSLKALFVDTDRRSGVTLCLRSFPLHWYTNSVVIFGIPGKCHGAREALLAIMLFYTLLSAGAVIRASAWQSSSVYRD